MIMVAIQFDYSKIPRMIYIVEEQLYLYGEMGVTVGSTF